MSVSRQRPKIGLLIALGWVSLLLGGAALPCAGEEVYQTTESFLAGAFDNKTPTAGVLSLTAEDQAAAKTIFGHTYGAARLRFWHSGSRTAWVLEEIGKTRPITTGYVVDGGKIHMVRVLTYRESQGWEVKNSFFTRQFKGAGLKSGSRLDLSKRVHNISGATLSVNALREMSRFALYLHGRATGGN